MAESGTARGAVEDGLVPTLADIKSLNMECISCLSRSSEKVSDGEETKEAVVTAVTGGEGEEDGGALLAFETKVR